MGKFGKIGVTLALSLIMSVTLFTSGVFAQDVDPTHRSAATSLGRGVEMLARTDVFHQSFNVQPASDQQPDYQQIYYQRGAQGKDACNDQSNCQNASRCIHIFRSAWGWIFICREW